MPNKQFHVALTADFYGADGRPRFRDFGLAGFDNDPSVDCRRVEEFRPQLEPDQVADTQAVIVLAPRVTPRTLANSHNLLTIARFGVGFDNVDVPACTAADVLVCIAAGAVDRPVAEATIAWMLALTHQVRVKDRLVRDGNWDIRSQYMGSELRDRTLGVIGLGGIGRALVKLLEAFGMKEPLAFDPFVNSQLAAASGVRLVTLDELLTQSDFVSIHCPLNEQTRNLIGRRELALMKPDAYLINTARGGIVDEDALYEVLKDRRIAGAGIDCFVDEPVISPHRFGEFDHVLLAPHSIAWTDELFRDLGRTVCQSVLNVAHGKRPHGIINPELLERESFREKWSRLALTEIAD